MSTKKLLWLVAFAMALWPSVATARAQETTTTTKTTSDDSQKPVSAFRIDFALDETENGKTVNTRHYSMNLVPGFTTSNEIKIGTKVPVEGKEGNMTYIDVGTNIWSRMVERGDSLQLEVRADLSNFANPEQESRTTMPLLRQLHISASTVATLGKPTIVGIVDDPNSKRQFVLTATVTKLK
jgi:hypothetical protein